MDHAQALARLRHIPTLPDDIGTQVHLLADEWFGAWRNPQVEPEAKLMLEDDLAGIVKIFGITRVSEAMSHHRERAQRWRPSIGELRDRCEQTAPRDSDATKQDPEMREHYETFRRHPERCLSVNECMVIGAKLGVERGQRRGTKNPMTDAEFEQRKAELVKSARARVQDEVLEARMSGKL